MEVNIVSTIVVHTHKFNKFYKKSGIHNITALLFANQIEYGEFIHPKCAQNTSIANENQSLTESDLFKQTPAQQLTAPFMYYTLEFFFSRKPRQRSLCTPKN